MEEEKREIRHPKAIHRPSPSWHLNPPSLTQWQNNSKFLSQNLRQFFLKFRYQLRRHQCPIYLIYQSQQGLEQLEKGGESTLAEECWCLFLNLRMKKIIVIIILLLLLQPYLELSPFRQLQHSPQLQLLLYCQQLEANEDLDLIQIQIL